MPDPELDLDLGPLLSTALGASHAIVGPRLADLIDPVPHEDLITSMRESIPALLLDLEGDTRNVLLTLARMWYTSSAGDIVAKDAAAAWALVQIPSEYRPALAHARAVYLGEQAEAFDLLGDGPAATAGHLAAAVTRLAG